MTLARKIWLPDDGLRTEPCRSAFNVLMCKCYKFYICEVVGVIIEYTPQHAQFNNENLKKERECVYCAVRTGCLYIIHVNLKRGE